MKKLTLGLLSVAMLGLASCSNDDNESTQNVTYPTVNLITPADGSASYPSEGSYSFFTNLSKGVMSVSTGDLMLNNSKHYFSTDTVPYLSGAYNNGMMIRVKNPKGYLDGDRTMPITDAVFDITSLFITPGIYVPGYSPNPPQRPMVIGQYKAGGWSVATFQKDATFFGSTVTSYMDKDGKAQEYKNEEIYYRVIMNLDKNTADLIIYNAKFAEVAPPLKPIIIKDLAVSWKAGAYTIEGKDVVPNVVEGNNSTPNDKYTFNKIYFATTNNTMTQAMMTYEVAGTYFGKFSGCYVIELKE